MRRKWSTRKDISRETDEQWSMISGQCSLTTALHRRPHRLLRVRIDFGIRLEIGLAVHPLVEARAFKTPAIAQLEGGNETFGGVLGEGVRRDTKVVGSLANIHHFANFRHKQIGAGSGVAHNSPPERRWAPGARFRLTKPVLLYITRFHLSLQGFLGSCGKFMGFPISS